jgi:hypothetical protein
MRHGRNSVELESIQRALTYFFVSTCCVAQNVSNLESGWEFTSRCLRHCLSSPRPF